MSSSIMSSSPHVIEDPKDEGGVDRISDLPDDIILNYFITPFSFKERFKTTTLSRRWRDLNTHCAELDFDLSTVVPFYSKPKRMIEVLNSVSQVLRSLRAPSIVKFHFKFCIHGIEDGPSRVDKLIKYAISRKVKDLRLQSSFIRGYTLGYDVLKHSPHGDVGNGIKSLTSLQLVTVDISGDVLEFILSHCPLLECLLVQQSCILVSLMVRSSKLKRLTLLMCYNLKELEIEAESLNYFNFNNGKRSTDANIIFKSAPMLVEAVIGGNGCVPPFSVFPQIAASSLQLSKLCVDVSEGFHFMKGDFNIRGDTLSSFCNVQHLEISAMYNGNELCRIMRFVHACPSLQKLKLKLIMKKGLWPEDLWPEADVLRGEEPLSESEEDDLNSEESENELELKDLSETDEPCLEHRILRVFEIHGFMGCYVDVELIMSVVESAINLQTIICDPHGIPCEKNHVHGILCDNEHPPNVIEASKSRAAKLAKILPPRVNFVFIE